MTLLAQWNPSTYKMFILQRLILWRGHSMHLGSWEALSRPQLLQRCAQNLVEESEWPGMKKAFKIIQAIRGTLLKLILVLHPQPSASVHNANIAMQSQKIRFRDSGCMAQPGRGWAEERLMRLLTVLVLESWCCDGEVKDGEVTANRVFSSSHSVSSGIFHSGQTWNLKSLLRSTRSKYVVVLCRASRAVKSFAENPTAQNPHKQSTGITRIKCFEFDST